MMKRFLLILLFPVLAQAQNVNVPDPNFLAKLVSLGVDTNGDMLIQQSEAQAVNGMLDLSGSTIYDLTGITAFTGLTAVNISHNNIALLSLSGMPNLQEINADHNHLTNVALSQLPELVKLVVSNNSYNGAGLTPLLPSLQVLDVSSNFIGFLDLSAAPGLKEFYASSNLLNDLNVAGLIALERIDCSFNAMTHLDVSGLSGLKYLNLDNNQLTSFNASGAPALEEFDISDNNGLAALTLTGLVNLKKLSCGNTSIGTLDVASFSNLEYLDCHNAHLPSLNVSGLIHLFQLDCAQNYLVSLDVSGLTALTVLNCNENTIQSLNLSGLMNLTQVGAYANEMTTLILAQNENLSFLNVYSNALSALDVTSLSNLTILFCSENFLSSLDVSHNSMLQQLVAYDNNLTTLDVSLNHQLVWISVSGNPVLESIFMKNGSDELLQADDISDLPLLHYVCADASQTEALTTLFSTIGNTAVTVNPYCSFVPGSAFNTLTGTARFDVGQDGCNITDPGLRFIKINMNADGADAGTGFASLQGKYLFHVPSGNYIITPLPENPSYFNVSPVSGSANFNATDGSVSNNDFCFSAAGVNPDLEIVIAPVVPARPGFEAAYKIVYRNKGNQVMSLPYGISFFYNQNIAQFVSANVAPSTNGPGALTWSYTNLMPYESRSIQLALHINASTDPINPVNIGDVLDFNASVSPIGGDADMADNYSVYHQVVVGSYDPNDIYCVEGDIVPPSEIGQYLHYIINFENTGNYPAENVVVKEVIDTTRFDLASLQFLDSSHPVDIRLHDNIAEMIFQNINLDTGGHGNVMLKIKSKGDLVPGDSVAKNAKIFFDYNAPVSTNMASTLFQTLSVPGAAKDASISVFPVPAHDAINIQADNAILSVEMYDVTGKLLEVTKQNDSKVKLDVSQRASGTYFLKIQTEHGMSVEKAVKK